MTEQRLNHKLDISKIQTLQDLRNVFECMDLVSNVSEENEDYELHKKYFTIPYVEPKLEFKLPRQSLEEISQECEDKFDKHIESIKHKFAELKCHQEYYYNQKFNRIIENFEDAKKYGSFPAKLDYSKLTVTGGSNITSSFVIKEGGKEVGYYTFGNGYLKYCMNKKPSAIVRFFMNKLLDFRWVDEK
jgi:arginyl-tRNA synthetase